MSSVPQNVIKHKVDLLATDPQWSTPELSRLSKVF
jgi:hypothetical protein